MNLYILREDPLNNDPTTPGRVLIVRAVCEAAARDYAAWFEHDRCWKDDGIVSCVQLSADGSEMIVLRLNESGGAS